MSGQAIIIIRDKQWTVSIANTYTELVTGLSGAQSIPSGTGVLFDLGTDYKTIQIDMTRMLFALDIVFINSTHGVVGVMHNVQPNLREVSFENNGLPGARCFLEVNAGEAEGIEVGDNVNIQGYTQPAQLDITSIVNFMAIATIIVMMGRLAIRVLEGPMGRPVLYGPRGERLLPQTQDKEKPEAPPEAKIWYLGEWWEEEYSTAECIVYRSADGKKRLYVYWDGTKEVKPAPSGEGERPQVSTKVIPMGTCYEDAWRFLIREEEGYLIHGTVSSDGKRIGHAWVETLTGYIWEPETKKFYTPEAFQKSVNPVEEQRYTVEQATIMASRTHNLGPWTEEERHFLKEKSSGLKPSEYLPQVSVATRLDGLQVVKAYKEISRHGEDKISVSLQAWAIFPRGRRPHFISMYRSGDEYVIQPLYAHIEEWVRVPVEKVKAWIKSLPVRHFEPMAVVPELREEAERLAREVDEPMDIVSLPSRKPQAKVIPVGKQPRRETDLEYLADSPEFLAQTIEAIGYRNKLDTTFQEAIARAKGLK